jgi:hypothetical protein
VTGIEAGAPRRSFDFRPSPMGEIVYVEQVEGENGMGGVGCPTDVGLPLRALSLAGHTGRGGFPRILKVLAFRAALIASFHS